VLAFRFAAGETVIDEFDSSFSNATRAKEIVTMVREGGQSSHELFDPLIAL
jgi:hypothetical protein